MKETDLYEPVRDFFSRLGYTIDAEVKGIDILCVRDDESIAIELKNQLNLKLIIQGALRQKMFDLVYVAIWTPKNLRQHEFKDKLYLLKRLGLGLIVVSLKTLDVEVYHDPIMHPIEEYQRRNRIKKKKAIEELRERRTHVNVGGSYRKKIMTSYKEDVLIILDCIHRSEEVCLSDVVMETQIKKAGSILQKNFYGWFKRIKRGVYGLTDSGYQAHKEYYKVIQKINEAHN